MKNILALNKISPLVNDVFGKKYKMIEESKDEVGILVRSFKMHEYTPINSVLCVGRAGAGVNNIPLDVYANKGIVVFNSPGANANAVKELVILGMLLCGRKTISAINWTQTLTTDVAGQVEKGKAQFIGSEILGKTLAVYGLGAIGKIVAVSAAALGMKVVGYDPFASDTLKQYLAANNVGVTSNLDALVAECDYITLHVPYNEQTKGFINKTRLATMKNGVNIINCARGELVENEDIKQAIKDGKVNKYVTDFPSEDVLGNEDIITFPHLGASTPEAEDNCAVMAGNELVDFIENGTIKNSVNFPNITLDRTGKQRLVLLCTAECDLNELPKQMKHVGVAVTSFTTQKGKTTSAAIFDFSEKLDAKTVEMFEKQSCIIKARLID